MKRSRPSRPIAPSQRPLAAFTLIEMLVVLIIISLVVGLSFPFMAAMLKTTEGRSGQATISMAVNAARIMNHRLSDNNSAMPGDYSGTAALFTPGGEIRFLINDREAVDGAGRQLEEDLVYAPNFLNGYKDIPDVEYLTLPSTAGVVGVVRDQTMTGGKVRLLMPPFAIRFNEFGHVANNEMFIFYNSNYDSPPRYGTTDFRNSSYNPRDFDPRANFNLQPHMSEKRYELPFEAIEVVSAVILYPYRELFLDKHWYEDTDPEFAKLTDPEFGKAMYYSPHTGLVLKE